MNPELTLLATLRDAHPRMLPERTLISEARLSHDDLTEAQARNHLRQLKTEGHAEQEVGADVTRWRITANGRARVADAGI